MLALGLKSGRVMVDLVMVVDAETGEEKWAVQAHPLNSAVRVAMSPKQVRGKRVRP